MSWQSPYVQRLPHKPHVMWMRGRCFLVNKDHPFSTMEAGSIRELAAYLTELEDCW